MLYSVVFCIGSVESFDLYKGQWLEEERMHFSAILQFLIVLNKKNSIVEVFQRVFAFEEYNEVGRRRNHFTKS